MQVKWLDWVIDGSNGEYNKGWMADGPVTAVPEGL